MGRERAERGKEGGRARGRGRELEESEGAAAPARGVNKKCLGVFFANTKIVEFLLLCIEINIR